MVVLAKLRQYRRVAVDISNEDGSQRVCDVSLGGMRALSNRALRMNDSIKMEIATAAGSLRMNGRLVRANLSGNPDLPYEYGFVYESLSQADQVRLNQFMEARGAGEVPAQEVGIEELQTLEDRIAELEVELAEAEKNASRARTSLAREGQKMNQVATHFECDRFMRLVSSGQPLITLVENPGEGFTDPFSLSVAATFKGSFDLLSVKADVDFCFSANDVEEALYVFYLRDLIDFA